MSKRGPRGMPLPYHKKSSLTIHELAQSADLRETMGTRARDFALKFYGEGCFASRYWRLIETVMGT